MLWDLKTGNVGPERFDISNPQSPYLISQQDGAYFSIPDFLTSAHTIENAADAEAYLSRLAQFATVLDNETAEQRRQAARGFLAPGWSLDLALGQMRELRAPAAGRQHDGRLRSSDARPRKGIAGDWKRARRGDRRRARSIPRSTGRSRCCGAAPDSRGRRRHLARAAAAAKSTPPRSAEATTTSFTPDEIHQLGLQQVAEISAELDKILRQRGL